VDGTAHRGRLAGQPFTACPLPLLHARGHHTGLVRVQAPVIATGDKAAAALATAPALIAGLGWHGRVRMGDARYCQRTLCQQVVDAGGDARVHVKGNRPALPRDVATLFAHRAARALNAARLPNQDKRQAVTHDPGHGRAEQRTSHDCRTLPPLLPLPP